MSQKTGMSNSLTEISMVYVALLRAVNINKLTVKMTALKRVFIELGFKDVKTFLASGNVLFSTNIINTIVLVQKIESTIKKVLKIKVRVLVRSKKEIDTLVKRIPKNWVNDKDVKCDVMFLWKEADNKNILKKLQYDLNIEQVKYVPGAVIWQIDRKLAGKSKMFKIIGTDLYRQMTIRNPNTVRKIYDLMKSY